MGYKDYDFIKEYFSEDMVRTPFADAQEEWRSWERFMDMLCMLLVVEKEQERPESLERIGCLLNDVSLVRALEPHEPAVFPERERVSSIFNGLLERGRLQEQALPLPLWQFFQAGLLSRPEMIAFLATACVDRNRKYERVFGILQEESGTSARPTVGLVCDLCSLLCAPEEQAQAVLLDEDSFLNRFLLQTPKEDANQSKLSRPLSLHKRVLSVLLGEADQLGDLSVFTELMTAPEELSDVICQEEKLDELAGACASAFSEPIEKTVFCLEGIKGAGKKFLMNQLSAIMMRDVLCVHMDKLLDAAQSEHTMQEYLKELILAGILEDKIIYIELPDEERWDVPKVRYVFSFLQDYMRVLFVGSVVSLPEELSLSGCVYRIGVNLPDSDDQRRLWELFSREYGLVPGDDVDLEELTSKYYMTPERIRRALYCVLISTEFPEEEDAPLVYTKKLLEEQIRRQCTAQFGPYAKKLESPFTKEDLELTAESRKLLEEAMNRIRYRSRVNNTWGFGKKLPYGKGLSIVFYGPPGTGKTMSAQVMANELGLDIYRIDLSQIGSKYIGETEKNLGAVFDAARYSNAILFFDEADALFSKRTDVSNSNDKHANTQTAYLLQKIEEYPGVSILATNVVQNFDNAFKRRMTYMIPVEQPDEQARLKLWHKVFPKETPIGDDVDLAVFARVGQLTGAAIKSAATAAAYLAAAENRAISRADLIEAVDAEYRKTGRIRFKNDFYANA